MKAHSPADSASVNHAPTPTPPSMDRSELKRLFNKDLWYNVPKCVTELCDALVRAVETNRYKQAYDG